jgi:hypothetical protein
LGVIYEYHQQKGQRVLMVEVPTQNLEDTKKKALFSTSGLWQLRGMVVPMKFAMANSKDLPDVQLDYSHSFQSHTTTLKIKSKV